MTLLNIYLGTTAMAWATSIIFTIVFCQRMKREGYKAKVNKSFLEWVIENIPTAFKLSIPGFNILITIGFLWMGDKLYEPYVSKSLREGDIYKPTEEELKGGLEKQGPQATITNVPKLDYEKSYDEMTREELLAILKQERTSLTGQSTPKVEDSFTFQKK